MSEAKADPVKENTFTESFTADSVKEETSTDSLIADSLPSKSAKGASFLILLQIGCRALTFIVNQVLLRFLSPRILGLSAQLELFSISTLYFSRESLRNALQHKPSEDEQRKTAEWGGGAKKQSSEKVAFNYKMNWRMQEVVNLSHAAIFIGLPLTVAFTWLYLRKADTAVLDSHHMRSSLYIYALATAIELLNEPAFNVARQEMMYATRASAEFLAFFTRALISCSISIWVGMSGRNLGVLPFAAGQLGYAITLNTLYLSNVYPVCAQNAVSLLAKPIASNTDYFISRFSRPLIMRTATLYGQNIFNQLLTYGDGYLIATFASLPSQGAYALASNYGGLLARIILQPIEESSRSLFGRLPPASQTPSMPKDTAILSQAKSHLSTLLRLYLLLSLFATCLGPPLTPILLRLVAGSRWTHTEAPAVLATYCYYIPLLAINGILEAFVSVVATDQQISRQTVWKIAFFGAFASTGFLVLRVLNLGAKGLVLANAVTMGLRIWWSWAFVRNYLGSVGDGVGLRVGDLLPRGGSVAVGVVARGALMGLENGIGREGGLGVLVRCAVVAGGCVLGVVILERDFILEFVPRGLVERVPFLRRLMGKKG